MVRPVDFEKVEAIGNKIINSEDVDGSKANFRSKAIDVFWKSAVKLNPDYMQNKQEFACSVYRYVGECNGSMSADCQQCHACTMYHEYMAAYKAMTSKKSRLNIGFASLIKKAIPMKKAKYFQG